MKKFVNKTLLFVAFFVLLVAVLQLSQLFLRESLINNLDLDLNGAKSVVVGHSHPECAFNDKIIDSFANLSRSGTSLFYTYIKLKILLELNHSVENVFVEFSNFDIPKSTFDILTFNISRLQRNFYEYSFFMTLRDKLFLLQGSNQSFFLCFIKSPLLSIYNYFINNRDKKRAIKIGRYLFLKRFKLKKDLKRLKEINRKQKKEVIVSINSLKILEEIIILCRRYKKNFFLIRSPVHKEWLICSNENIYKKILEEKFSDTLFLDFSKFPLSEDEYGDASHLNYLGARKFSFWFNEMMKKGLLEKKDKQKFIDEEIKILKIKNKVLANILERGYLHSCNFLFL